MKASEIRDMNLDEMHSKISDLREELFNLRFQHEIGQLENPQRIKQTKKDRDIDNSGDTHLLE